jgi:hypothetical protein
MTSHLSTGARRPRVPLAPVVALVAIGLGSTSGWLAACGSSNASAPVDAGDAGDGESIDSAVDDLGLQIPDVPEVSVPDITVPVDSDTLGPDGMVSCMLVSCPGQCVLGRCLTIIASGGAYDLAVQAGKVYWTSQGATPGAGLVLSLPTTPTATTGTTILGIGQTAPSGIAVNGSHVFWVDDSATSGSVLSTLLAPRADAGTTGKDGGARDGAIESGGDSGGPPVTTIASGQSSPGSIAIDETSLYWTTTGSMTDNYLSTVVSAALGGGTPVTLYSARGAWTTLGIDATDIYWIDMGVTSESGAVLKIAKTGGMVTTLATGENFPTSLAVDSTFVYWTRLGLTMNTSSVVKLAKSSALDGGRGNVVTVADGLGVPTGITADGTNVYWAVGGGDGTGSIQSAPANGNVITTLATGLDSPFALTTDATTLYWTDDVDGTITSLLPK